MIQVDDTAIPEVKLVTPRRFGDDRGWFSETWTRSKMQSAGLDFDFSQDNHSYSSEPHTLRGLHYQAPPFAQTKLVRVVRGSVLDVVIDVRVGSPTFMKSVAYELSADTGMQLLAPRGFLHGFLTLTPDTEVVYKVDAPFSAEADGSVRFDDPVLGVDWGVPAEKITLSGKDQDAPRFADWDNPFVYESG
ncbi:MAG: dTDP-4-dehydrorhamnose 3,5-epimerase [Pseudomonadota bacterium]